MVHGEGPSILVEKMKLQRGEAFVHRRRIRIEPKPAIKTLGSVAPQAGCGWQQPPAIGAPCQLAGGRSRPRKLEPA